MYITKETKWEPDNDMTYLVSNSEVAAFLSCERKHYYAHALNLEPKNFSTSLSRGIIGHEALAEFYKTGSADQMQAVVDNYMMQEIQKHHPGKEANLLMLSNLKGLLERYVEFQKDDNWEILAVEEQYTLPLFDQFGYTMRLDLLIKFTTGPKAGQIWVVDHKFVYDFYSQDDLSINAQMPKYLATVRNATGLHVVGGILNELRHRTKKGAMTDDELFRRESITPSAKRIRNVMREQILASERIILRHDMPLDEYGQTALRTLNPMVCKNCPFLAPCTVELNGESADLMFRTEYQSNSYGYNNKEVE